MTQWIYEFEKGDGKNKMLLGGKGANLCEMTQIGLAVPPGFTITTEACLAYLEHDRLPDGLMDDVRRHMEALEGKTGKSFGGAANPLLVSVRSGSSMSMPGMMDTILNLGLNPATLKGLIEGTGNPRFAEDAYRRFIQLYGKIALGVSDEHFDAAMAAMKAKVGVEQDVDLKTEHLAELVTQFKSIVEKHTGKPFPDDPYEQLEIAIGAVFKSWNGKRAIDYRRQFKITKEMANGTAVNICTMVFGNMGNDSGTGVGFTRDPGTGHNSMFGEYLVNAQGEDVVAGIRTPKAIAEMANDMPDIHRQLVELRNRLESHYKEVQDFEFTIEKNRLYCLQTRNGKMNARATVITSVEMANDGLISHDQAILRVAPSLLEQLMVPQLAKGHATEALATGLPASPGAASGHIVFDADTAEARGNAGEKVILVREETKPEDIHGFFAAQGVLTARGGKTSHAAVVARGMGKPCVSGCDAIVIDHHARKAKIGSRELVEGDIITIDGGNGKVYPGEIPTVEAEFFPELGTLLSWADERARLKVRANADTPDAALKARQWGATGIGLVRTERMFNDVERLPIVVQMIMAKTVEERQEALDQLLPFQRSDFKGIFTAMAGLPVTVRLLDPPLHEFLPSAHDLERDIRAMTGKPEMAAEMGKREAILKKVRDLFEVNPMLGHRGVRLGLTNPEIYRMQIRAIFEATAECIKEGVDAQPEIMAPQVVAREELVRVKQMFDEIKTEVEAVMGSLPTVKFGTMIEAVRAALRAENMAKSSEFFSFGTNDLTQATFSFSREDAENKFLPFYIENGLLKENPFEVLDTLGVGRLMKIAVEEGRIGRPGLKVGICGEHGGHPESIEFCHGIGLDYVSCSGPRVPIARLAAAQANLKTGGGKVANNG